jgi:hypothetical protein
MSWARLLERVFDLDLKRCPNCGGELKIIAAILETPVIERIFTHLGLQARAPARAAAPVQAPHAALSTADRCSSGPAPRASGRNGLDGRVEPNAIPRMDRCGRVHRLATGPSPDPKGRDPGVGCGVCARPTGVKDVV